MRLPGFKYHPDPIGTGAIVPSSETCECCGFARGYRYSRPILARTEIENVCPWCIADGSACRKFDADINEVGSLQGDGIAASIREEIATRTPGYVSWQGENWLSCCDDACEFWGDASAQDVRRIDRHRDVFPKHTLTVSDIEWFKIVRNYEPAGNPTFYKFVCRHCRRVKYAWYCD